MARAVETRWEVSLSGLVVVPDGHGLACERIEVVEAAHPHPDERGRAAAKRLLDLAHGAGAGDLVLALVSGGGSSLLTLPAGNITQDEKRRVLADLLGRGAAVSEINLVRSHLSAIKAGRLALAAVPTRTVTLLISDVPGDDPALVASGPTVASGSTPLDAQRVLERYTIEASPALSDHLRLDATDAPAPGDARLAGNEIVLVAGARDALNAAAAAARALGITPHILGTALEGESRELAREHAEVALRIRRGEGPLDPPCVLLSGGETTVSVLGDGRGGRNGEYLLALALALEGEPQVWALAADTDGIDGTMDNAGALCPPDLLARAAAAGVEPGARLERNDSYGFFSALGELVVTGPTRTNVSDFRAILVSGAG
jgi:hydroxypyruvate reductase